MPDVEKPKNPTLAERVSSLGILDRLPPEILYMLLGMLDIQTIASFAKPACSIYILSPSSMLPYDKNGAPLASNMAPFSFFLPARDAAGSVFATIHHYECFHQKKQKDILVFQSGISDDYPQFPLFLATMAYPAPPLRGLAGSLV
ncbi:uncharacterized protein FPRO_09869 [Fusarium proliferatum ET1]|uniref:Uncharacterized protein n=1 Tax=Fusarium proliferatum (strain ET1) TaxID=1227346 RepID=A0A1L7VR99_FUSPR|nr:uncharacterized protein FPRO_09869 [Fusarium proliferatum ET1]CZR42566.1 uncharacterized protein FPRO_09869 [Fusarium proliferatum ET1]